LDGTPSWSLPTESTLQQQSRQKVKNAAKSTNQGINSNFQHQT